MINRSLLWVAVLFLGACATANKSQVEPLLLEWELMTTDYQGSGETLSHLIITNQSTDTLKAGEWKLYHNSGSLVVADSATTEVALKWINGDYNQISPLDRWQPLAPGETRVVPLKIRNLRNLIHLPRGFYLVSSNYPEGISLELDVKDNEAIDAYEARVAADIYTRNERIQAVDMADLPPVFPTPASFERTGDDFVWDGNVVIVADGVFDAELSYLQEEVSTVLKKRPAATSTPKEGQGIIRMEFAEGLNQEGYRLHSKADEILLEASEPAGMFYAIQSLKSLFPPDSWQGGVESLVVPGVRIQDEPRFGHRAFMLDVARNFQPVEQVLKVLDLMAMYKINIFHFHLTEDEAWRLEIPGLPELTEIGARRGHTEQEMDRIYPAYGSGPDPDQGHGSGYYTRDEFIKILAYAKARHIQVIPEIDSPGHARAAVRSMDARFDRFMAQGDSVSAWQYRLSDPEDASVYRSAQNWTDNVMNVALPSVYTFMEKVIDEIILMYREADAPLDLLHIGGDEVPNGVWEKSPLAERFLAENPQVPETDELWYYYLDRMSQILQERGLHLYGWEEVGMKKADVNGRRMMVVEPRFGDRQFYVDVWNNLGHNVDLAYRLANAGYQVVLTNVSNFYFDLAYNHGFYEMGHNWGGLVDVEKSFRFVPYDYFKSMVDDISGEVIDQKTYEGRIRLTEAGKANIVGIQAPLWAEYILGSERMEYMLLPKLLGMAERAWAPEPVWEIMPVGAEFDQAYYPGWSAFVHQVGWREFPKLDQVYGGFNYRIPSPGVQEQDGMLRANVQIPGLEIRYTTDGSDPTAGSALYTEPVSASGTVIFRVFNKEGRSSHPVKIRK